MDRKQYPKEEIAKVTYDHILFLALALACLAAGTAWGSDKSTNQSKAGLAFDTFHVNLGNVEQDSKGTVTFLAINYGPLPINVGPVNIVALQGGDTGSSLQDTVPVSPNGVYAIPIQVGPYKQLGPHTMQVTVTSNDPKAQTTTLTVDFTVVEGPARQVKGPRLRVDKQLIDIGNVPYDWPLYEQFTLRNDGDAPLVLAGTPTIRVELGCWPPSPVVGTTTLQPGQETTMELRLYMGMHKGMGGQHQFAMDIRSNDPSAPVKTVVWRFNAGGGATPMGEQATVPPPAGQPAPGFDLSLLSGKKVALKEFRGKAVLIVFWQSG